MDVQLLEDIGLTKAQAITYRALIQSGSATAPILAEQIGESRSNTYKLLDKLCDLGLAAKDSSNAKVRYFPTSPTALEQLIQKQAADLHLRERRVKAELPTMLDFFFAHSERPAIRFFQGKEGLRQIYSDMLATGETLYLVRSPEDVRFYDEDFFKEIRSKRRLLGIKTVGITPDVASANHDPAVDAKNLFERIWVPADAYDAKVEWNIAGDKVALISYGTEAMGIIIESKQIADSFRQVFALASGNQTNAS